MGTFSLFGTEIHILPTLIIAGSVVGIAVLGGLGTDPQSFWYLQLRKPSWQPPNWAFGPAWSTIYFLLIVSAVIVWHSTGGTARTALMVLFALNGALNLAWTFIFFQSHAPLIALFDIIGLFVTILWLMIKVWPIATPAALMLLPYLLWVAYATSINWAIVKMNE